MPPIPLRALSFCFVALALASCVSTTGPRGGQTQYLEAFDPNSVPHSALYNQDMDSYWDGDGMVGAPSIVIDISDQKAYFYKGNSLAGVSALSTGDEKHPTTQGRFKITEKDQWHKSNLYGDFVDGAGNVVVANIDVTKDKAPPGTRFEGSKMHHFMRFVGGIGMHEGFLPGYPASHGCVRMPGHMAAIFYNNVEKGTPVTVRP
ncbi:L,D-transpeptidase catalytic domain [Prosthecobacter debontii]|uniref:L,D-transpeptidase catalytic domain n=1 Tax=Prosthecobacter debontii TaxID=48467 RepID=A0A1T4YK49_9BACT|nr:L,D-transpeptidase family protein [Prosthecobacter debontii]SKB02152.1 L,D-transpeptidase catalytic domain [Prosthecobacter debontii]